VLISGGLPQVICDIALNSLGGGAWNREGVILFTPDQLSALYRVSAGGGAKTPVTTLDRTAGEIGHSSPSFLPDGRHFLFSTANEDPDAYAIKVGSLDSADVRVLMQADSNAVYDVKSERLLFLQDGTLVAQSFDVNTMALSGSPIPILDEVIARPEITGSFASYGFFGLSESGVLAYRSGTDASQRFLQWVDRSGRPLSTLGAVGRYQHVEFSPDGSRVAVDQLGAQSGRSDIWLIDATSGGPSRLTFDTGRFEYPRWSPDSSRLIFSRLPGKNAPAGLVQKAANGSSGEDLLFGPPERSTRVFPSDWSADGRFVVFRMIQGDPRGSLWVLPLTEKQPPVPVPHTDARGVNGRFSPDGRWLAYSSSETGRYEVFVQPFPATGAKYQVSRDGGQWPRWRRDGKELFFGSESRTLMAASLTTDNLFHPGQPTRLFDLQVTTNGINRYPYAVSADGQRFLMIAQPDGAGATPLTVVLNWSGVLRK
jgi:WD40 repeat protein